MNKKDWMLPYVKKHKKVMILAIVLGILGFGSGAMLLFISGFLITKSSLQPQNIMVVYVPIVAVRAFSIGQAVFKYLHRLVGHEFVLRILEKMRSKLYHVLEPQALLLRSRHRTGDLLGVLSDDIEHLQHLFLRTIFPSSIALFLYGILIAVLGYFDWIFALQMALILAVIIFLVPLVSLFITKKQHLQKKQVRSELYQQLTDAVSGISDWQASGRKEEFFIDYRQKEGVLLSIEQKMQTREHYRNLLLQLFIGIAVIAMLFWTNTQVENGAFAPTVIAAFVLMTLSLGDAFIPVSEAVEHIPTFEDSFQRIYEIEDQEVKLRHVTGINQTDHQLHKQTDEKSGMNIRLEHVSFRYSEEQPWIIDDISLQMDAGKKIAILGRSGAGKSTLLKLLSGAIQPSDGSVFIGDTEATTDLLAKSLSVLNQKPHLFDTTVGNNIRLGKPNASDEEIWDVAKKAQISALIEELPLGLNTPMHEMGKRFSGGERQRIAFARVLLQDTPIIILDEPTIGLDPVTEHGLLETMFQAAKDKTIIWVTHHLAGIHHADEVIFIEDGKIMMQGSHEELLQINDKYRALYEMERI